MTSIVRVDTLQNEAASISISTTSMQRRIIQRVSYVHRIGWWRGNNIYYWVPGAYVDFRPLRADTRIRATFSIPTRPYGSTHMIMHWIFYVDEVEYGRFTRGGHHVENAFATEWDVPSWGEGIYARIGHKCRSYSEGNHNAHLYLNQYWDGSAPSSDNAGQAIVEEYVPAAN